MDYSKYKGRAFFHTNRTRWKNKKISQYSMHLLKSGRCGKSKPVSLYPSIVCLEDVDTYFMEKDRNKILNQVKKRIDECSDMKDVRRTVYGGLCGKVISLNNEVFAENWADLYPNWIKAEFPITFPPSDYYKYMENDCKDPSLLNTRGYEMYLEKRDFGGWFYENDNGTLTAFNQADKAIMLGSEEPTQFPKWEIYVLNPSFS